MIHVGLLTKRLQKAFNILWLFQHHGKRVFATATGEFDAKPLLGSLHNCNVFEIKDASVG